MPLSSSRTQAVSLTRIPFLTVVHLAVSASRSVLDSGGPYGSLGVDYEFEKLLCKIFGEDFIEQFKIKRPAAWVDLMIAFESRKRAAAPDRTNPLNITLPFSFIDYYKKFRGHSVEHALRKSK